MVPAQPEEEGVAEVVVAAVVEGLAGIVVGKYHLHCQPQPAAAVEPRQLAALGRQRPPTASAAPPASPRSSTPLRVQLQLRPQRRHPLRP